MSSIDEEDEDQDYSINAGRARMVDWVQSFKLPLTFLFALPAIAIMVGEIFKNSTSVGWQTAPYVIIGVAILLVPMSLISQLIGTSFDGEQDRLSYPYYFLRRSLKLSEISDANCQTYSKQVADFLGSLLMGGNRKKALKHYVVNLSGDFGARRIVFRSKYKRDQFLSLIRSFAPQTRITRWS